jgi:hypothetical protein
MPLEICELAVDHDEDVLAHVLDVLLAHPEAAEDAPEKRGVHRKNLADGYFGCHVRDGFVTGGDVHLGYPHQGIWGEQREFMEAAS